MPEDLGPDGSHPTYLLADVIRDYLADAKGRKRSYRDDVRFGRVWIERLGGRMLDEITTAELEKIRTDRLQTVTPATINREMGFLKHVYNVAIRDSKTESNPVARLRMLREPSGRTRYLSDDEETRLTEALPSDTDRQQLQVLLNTGLRKSEFLGLRWRYVDFKAWVLTVPRSKNGAVRHVPINSTVRGVLSRLPRPLDSSALVFPNSVGGPDLRWAEKTFPAAVRAAQIDDFRLHDCRHTFASRLAMQGVDLRTIQEVGGWRSLSMVARYSHLSPGHRHNAVEALVTRRRETDERSATGNGVAP
jgi:integrase